MTSPVWTPCGPAPRLFGELGELYEPGDPSPIEPCVWSWKRERYEVEVFERPFPEREQRQRRIENRVVWSFTIASDGEESTFTPAGSWSTPQGAAKAAEVAVEERLSREIAAIASSRSPR